MEPTGDQAGDGGSHEAPHLDPEMNLRTTALTFLSDYGWFVVIAIGIVAFLWQKYGAELWARSTADHESISVVKKNDDASSIMARHEAMLAARQRMQEEQDRLSAAAKEEMAKREEERRQQKIEEWERHKQGGGFRSKVHFPEAQAQASTSGSKSLKPQAKKPLRPNDYNPLSGSGGCNYRPSRRNFSAGGG